MTATPIADFHRFALRVPTPRLKEDTTIRQDSSVSYAFVLQHLVYADLKFHVCRELNSNASKDQAALSLWDNEGPLDSDALRTFFFLAHGCHAALDAPKKVEAQPESKSCYDWRYV